MDHQAAQRELFAALTHMVSANRQDNSKGKMVQEWFENQFGESGKSSVIYESKQIGNRVVEQFKHKAHHIIFVYVPDVTVETIIRKIYDQQYSELQTVFLVKYESESLTATHLLIAYESDITAFYKSEFKGIVMEQLRQKNLSEQESIRTAEVETVEYAWYVGSKHGDMDKTDEFITSGTWVNGWDDKYIETVKSVRPGDRIAIKSNFTRKKDIPFENNDKMVSCVYIKATGIITENPGDGKNLKVDWECCNPFKVWYISTGAIRDTIDLVRADTSWKHKALLDFTFAGAAQDYDAFLATVPTAVSTGAAVETIDDSEVGVEPDEIEFREYFPISMKPEQIIFFGAPGTGKSFDIDQRISTFYANPEAKAAHSIRVIFYPDYEYSDFVGALRPVRHPTKGLDYEFIPGPMTRILAECFKHPAEVFFLIIEEINRGNAPAIFGDLFQLLDRSSSGRSVYEINNSEVADCLQKETKYLNMFMEKKIWFPSNLSVLCSMNTADQNVFVLDTAFSRRFERVYIKIDFDRLDTLVGARKNIYTGEGGIFGGDKHLTEVFKDTELASYVNELEAEKKLHRNWPTFALLANRLIDIINGRDGTEQISEDKKLGPFFVSEFDLSSREAFLNKVAYYLKQDVFRYVEQYFDLPFQTIFEKYTVTTGDLFALLKMGE